MEKLFTAFRPANEQEWMDRLEKDLKGTTFDQLSITDRNGITIQPFYAKERLTGSYEPVYKQNGWDICSRITVQDAGTANKEALHELTNGASGLLFIIPEDTNPEILLEGIQLQYICTCFRISATATAFINKLRDYLAKNNLSRSDLKCDIIYDCIGGFLKKGYWNTGKQDELETWRQMAAHQEISLGTDSECFQNAGTNAVYEIACALAHLNEYLQLYPAKDITGIKRIYAALATDTRFFEQVAKLRAFRNLLNLLCSAYSINPELHLHVSTSNIYRTTYDSYNNLLRDTLSGMSAVLGGCNSLYIYPFNDRSQHGDPLGKRLSRNQQLIFKEESYLDKVADVAAGSYYIETLTDEIGQKAWALFKSIEKDGGLIRIYENGTLQQQINEQAQSLINEYKEGKKVLTGVNKFPNPNDPPVKKVREENGHSGIKAINLEEEII